MRNGLFVWDSLGNYCVFGKTVVGEVEGKRASEGDTTTCRVWETCFLCTLNTVSYLQLNWQTQGFLKYSVETKSP